MLKVNNEDIRTTPFSVDFEHNIWHLVEISLLLTTNILLPHNYIIVTQTLSNCLRNCIYCFIFLCNNELVYSKSIQFFRFFLQKRCVHFRRLPPFSSFIGSLMASLIKWLSVRLWTKWWWVRVQLQSCSHLMAIFKGTVMQIWNLPISSSSCEKNMLKISH